MSPIPIIVPQDSTKPQVRVTEYRRPHGSQHVGYIDCTPEQQQFVQTLPKHFTITCEQLRNGGFVFYLSDEKEHTEVDIALSVDARIAFDKLIENAIKQQ